MGDVLRHELPWKACIVGGSWDVTTDTGDPRDEFSVLEYAEREECEFIARAANCHADLLAALKGFLHADPDVFATELAAAKAAIRKAEGMS